MKALALLISLSLLVVTHELGHLCFAKLFHTRVRRFYVFFNWKFSLLKAKKFDGKWHFLFFNAETPESWDEKNLKPEDQDNTLWGIGWIPLGGYCDVAGMIDETKKAEDLESTPQPWEYRTKPRWQRLLILSGGVLTNFVSALIIFTAIFTRWGTDELPLQNAKMGYEYHQILLDEGFRNGDIIYSIDGKEETDCQQALYDLVMGSREVTVMRGDSLVTLALSSDLTARISAEQPKMLMDVRYPFVINGFTAGSAGKHAGLEEGDSLVSISGTPTPTAADFVATLPQYPGDTVTLGFYRSGQYHELDIPLSKDKKIGAYSKRALEIYEVRHIDYTFWEAIPAGISHGWKEMVNYVSSLKILFTKNGTQNLGGFITMGSLFPDHWDWYRFWNLTAMLALVLAFMNIIPIPGLDGGHIVITLWEMVTGKPVNEKVLNVIQYIGLTILLLLLVVANGNDVIRLFNGRF